MGAGEAVHGSFHCAGVRIDEIGPSEAVAILCGSRYGTARRTHLCNSYTLSVAMRDVSYRQLLNASDLNFADGHYVAMVGRWRGGKVMTERVYGPTLMLKTIDQGRDAGLRHYLYGSEPRTVERLATALRDRYPGVEIVGVESPPFRPLTTTEEQSLFERVRAAKPDVFWVGLGTPRQDTFVAKYAESLGCTVVPVGAAFDFHSGNKRSAPALAQKLGLEWAFRFATEPVRLWRRYVFGIPVFMVGVVTDRFFRGRPDKGGRLDKGARPDNGARPDAASTGRTEFPVNGVTHEVTAVTVDGVEFPAEVNTPLNNQDTPVVSENPA